MHGLVIVFMLKWFQANDPYVPPEHQPCPDWPGCYSSEPTTFIVPDDDSGPAPLVDAPKADEDK